MMKFSKGSAASVLFSIIAMMYFSWSQVALYKYREALEIEKSRVYNIADHLELWKEISITYNGYLDVEKLSQDPRNIEITKINRKNGTFIPDSENLYVMYYDKLNNQRKKELKRFFSDLVLNNYFYVITDHNGKIKEIFWDKP